MQQFTVPMGGARLPINFTEIGSRVVNVGPGTLFYSDDDASSFTGSLSVGATLVLSGVWWFTATVSPATIRVTEITGGQPAMEVWRNTNQSIPDNVLTDVSWEEGNSNGERASGLWVLSSPTVITFRELGMYLVTASFTFASNSTGLRYANIFKTNWDGPAAAAAVSQQATNGQATRLQVHTHLKVNGESATPAIKCQVLQNSGGALNLTSDFTTTGFAPAIQVIRIADAYRGPA